MIRVPLAGVRLPRLELEIYETETYERIKFPEHHIFHWESFGFNDPSTSKAPQEIGDIFKMRCTVGKKFRIVALGCQGNYVSGAT